MNDFQAKATIRGGIVMAVGVFAAWGLLPGYFKLLIPTPPLEVMAHRIVWSFLFMALVVAVGGRRLWADLVLVLRTPKSMGLLALSAVLIAVNWLIYVGAVADGHVVEASLGYFICPLTNVGLGCVFLGERLGPMRRSACIVALLAVAGFAYAADWQIGRALLIAASFGLYGLVRKAVRVDALPGFAIESALLFPVALLYLVILAEGGSGNFHPISAPVLSALLAISGVITAVPLIFYSAAARRLKLSTLGMLNYLAPSLQFLCGVFLFAEPVTPGRLVAFVVLWGALGLFTAGEWWDRTRMVAARSS